VPLVSFGRALFEFRPRACATHLDPSPSPLLAFFHAFVSRASGAVATIEPAQGTAG
jgi:hypothetical protein